MMRLDDISCLSLSVLLISSLGASVSAEVAIEEAMIDAYTTCLAWAERGRPVPEDIWQRSQISEDYDLTGSVTSAYNEYRSWLDPRLMLTVGLQEKQAPPSEEPNMRWCSVDVSLQDVGDIAPAVVAAWGDKAEGYDIWHSYLEEFREGGESLLNLDRVGELLLLRRCDGDVLSSISVVEYLPSRNIPVGAPGFFDGRLGAEIKFVHTPYFREEFGCEAG